MRLFLLILLSSFLSANEVPFFEEVKQLGLKMVTHEYPKEIYDTKGAAVVLYDKVKLLP
jgi:hypothetical protein